MLVNFSSFSFVAFFSKVNTFTAEVIIVILIDAVL